MNIYPAMFAEMGSWHYYVVKMSMREVAESISFGYEVYEDRTLDDAIQRTLKEGRVRQEIVAYLKRQPDRFFNAIVIAALGGDPKFFPVHIADEEQFSIFQDDARLNETFGVMRFDGSQEYYALDGQHRLSAIKTLLDKSDPLSEDAPENFSDEELAVIVVVPKENETRAGFLKRYRRLFSNLNRYAKATDTLTNIIMDEDDAFAILTRRLVTEHEFFKWAGSDEDSQRVKTKGGKNLRSRDPQFTSLQTLYEMNEDLLSSKDRAGGWGPQAEDVKLFKRFRPSDELLESLYGELEIYWDGLLEAIPDLTKAPALMRQHDLTRESEEEEEEVTDHLLFWPIGQNMLAELGRIAMDWNLPDPDRPTLKEVVKALKPLGAVEWRLHEPPWRFFLLTQDPNRPESWKMRSEDRAEAVRIGLRIQKWVAGLDELDQEDIDALYEEWHGRLLPAQSDEDAKAMWKVVAKLRAAVADS